MKTNTPYLTVTKRDKNTCCGNFSGRCFWNEKKTSPLFQNK